MNGTVRRDEACSEARGWLLGSARDTMQGFVSLVGAGPGDPELLTLKAARRLEAADLVLYDTLVPSELVALAPRAQRFCVGKRASRKSVAQETIHRLMIRAARAGKRVVRLKCGDPFVLGRGGEEALALRAAGITCEVVPGVTSAVAAPELAGVPVTHRGLASGFAVVSGHSEEAFRPILDAVTPNSLTIIVLMGLRSRGAIAHVLIERGWRQETPTAVVTAASTPEMQTWSGQLDELATAPVASGSDGPGTIIIGEVVALRPLLAEDRRPLLTAKAIALGN